MPNLSINSLPDEVLLDIFDSYRQSSSPYDEEWRKKFGWLNLAHVCRRWRAAVLASSSRLDLTITVGPRKPDHIQTVLSSPLPIFLEYQCWFEDDITGSALWRMRAALRQRDRVRGISFGGQTVSYETFIRETNFHFPALESLMLGFSVAYELDIPDTFLKGPDQSHLRLQRLRRLELYGASLVTVSGLLLSATALTDLTLHVIAPVIDPSQGTFFPFCLQSMQCLRSLHLTFPDDLREFQSQHWHSTPKDIVPLLKLTHVYYFGPIILLNDLMSGLSAPSLQDVYIILCDSNLLPILHLPRFIDGLREQYRTVNVIFNRGSSDDFCLSLLTHSGNIDHLKPSFRLLTNHFPESIEPIASSGTSYTTLATAEELALFFHDATMVTEWQHNFPLRDFLRLFRSVKVLRLEPFVPEVALSLQQDDGEALLPILEQIELSVPPILPSTEGPDEEYQRRTAAELAAFEPFVSAREQTGYPVKIFHREMSRPD